MAKVKRVIAIECPECGELMLGDEKDDSKAREAFAEHVQRAGCGCPDSEEAYQCTECDEVYLDKDEAKECCDVG